MCFFEKFAKFLKIPILKNICERLLLKILSETLSMPESHNIVILKRMNGLILLRSEAVVQKSSVKDVFLEICKIQTEAPAPQSIF